MVEYYVSVWAFTKLGVQVKVTLEAIFELAVAVQLWNSA